MPTMGTLLHVPIAVSGHNKTEAAKTSTTLMLRPFRAELIRLVSGQLAQLHGRGFETLVSLPEFVAWW